jgi:predicted O-linked N-acetylglucosamine transferase (SPINDLY family)
MGLTSLCATSVDQYVDVAVGLGIDNARNADVRNAIRERADVLYENPTDVESWDNALRLWMEIVR